MELPLGGPALRHYTQSRPRPHRQKLNYRPSRPQETIIESENETLEFMGRVDEGVEEFFTKRVLPTDTPKPQDEETITVHEVAPASSVPCPPPSKTLRRKLGDFFTLKKRRGLKSETSHEGRPKKASIADLIRPLREVARSEKEKDKDRVKEHDKENEKEKAKEQPSAVTGESGIRETPVSGAPPLRGDAAPPRRALREGKSQSLILLSGSAAAGSTNARNTAKKQLEGQHSFEQKLHLMLQRIGVSKPQPGETQNPEGEMKKAESEGTIIDSKPEPPPTFSKPRTMSASSDTRHQIRASVSAHEAAGKPALLPKPVIKPGPPPTTSGRNTPENELAQIEEAEKNTPTKQSPASSLTAPALTDVTSSVPTISNSIPDSTDLPGSASSTVTPSDQDICTASVVATTAAISATKDTAVDSIASIPETSVCTTDLPTTTVTTTLTSITTATEPLPAVSVTSTTSESITLVVSVSSTSPTTTGPSITASETASAPSSESSVTTASTNLPIKSDLPEPKGIFPADATAAGDATIPVTTAASSLCTSTSDTPSSSSIPLNLMSEASDEATSVTSVLLITETTSFPLNSSVITTTAASTDTPFTTSSTTISATLTSPTTTSSYIAETISPTSSDSMNSVSTSNIIPLSSSGPSDSSVPSTSSSDTNPTDTTSTATSLNRADTTSTSSSATTTMAVSSALTTDSDPPLSNNVSTTLTPTSTSLTAAVNSSATSHRVTSPAPSNDSPCQDDSLSPEERSGKGSADKVAADGELDMIHEAKLMETDEKQETLDSEKKSDASEEKQAQVDSEATRREAQDESVEVEDILSKPASGKKDVQSKDEGMTEGGKEEETQPVSDK